MKSSKERLTTFAVDVVKFCRELRQKPEARHIADQLVDSATSTAANYRAACRGRSRREFIAKLGVALEEADESVGWLIVIIRSELAVGKEVNRLLQESQEIVAILAASRRTAEGGRAA